MVEFARPINKKQCPFCKNHVQYIDYKDVNTLRHYITDRAKIKSRRVTGVCTQHQHMLATAIKRARKMALLPYTIKITSGSGSRRKH